MFFLITTRGAIAEEVFLHMEWALFGFVWEHLAELVQFQEKHELSAWMPVAGLRYF